MVAILSPTSLSLTSATSASENRALEFFYHNTAPKSCAALALRFGKAAFSSSLSPNLAYAMRS
jgi:hypothetical protein